MKLKAATCNDDIPTSPMADIAFLLVIYFMVTVTFAVSKGLDFSLPEDAPPAVIDPVESVLVEVVAGGGLIVDRRPMTPAQLLPYLAPKLRRNPTKPVILRTHPDAGYGSMVAVFDLLRQGRDKLGLERDIHVVLPSEREIAVW